VAKLLPTNGYAAGSFGKWHLVFGPEHCPGARGFDEFFGFLHFSIEYFSHRSMNGDPAPYENTELVEENGYIIDRAVSFRLSKRMPISRFSLTPPITLRWRLTGARTVVRKNVWER